MDEKPIVTASQNSDSAVNEGEDMTSESPKRAQWGSQVEFILTLVGYAVGLGNIWRFPYLCYRNGGGAFLIPYFGSLALIGLPIFFMEVSFGQFTSRGPIASWTLNPLFKGLGYSMVIVDGIIGLYYNIIIAWAFHYFFSSMNSQVPWESCGNWWNTDNCITADEARNMISGANFTRGNITIAREDTTAASEEYFYNRVLQISDGIDDMGTIVWELALCLLLSWTIIFFVLIKGISSLGKVVYFSTIFPYVVLTIMMIRGVTLDGAKEGIIYYLKPDFSRLTDARAWSDAATQIFFSLSTCTGGIIAMSSYNQFNNNVLRDSILVPIINCATSFYGGFAIFSVLGYMAKTKGVDIADVAASGPGLVFVVFPEGISTMPIAPFWAILFFAMMLTLGFSSEFSIAECLFTSVLDEVPWLNKSRWRTIGFRLVGCILFYVIGLSMVTNGGFYLFNIFDFYVGGYPLLIIGLFEVICICYIYGYSNFADDIAMMIGKRPTIYVRACWCVVTPLMIATLIVFMAVQDDQLTLFSEQYVYPLWAQGIGWLVVAVSIFLIPVWLLVGFLRKGGWKLLLDLMKPTEEWGPANPIDRTGRYASSLTTSSSENDASHSGEVSTFGTESTDKTLSSSYFDSQHVVVAVPAFQTYQNTKETPPLNGRQTANDYETFEEDHESSFL